MHVRLRATTNRGVATLALAFLSGAFAGCAAMRLQPPSPPTPPAKITAVRIEVPKRDRLPGLVGRMQRHTIRPKETLLDVARDAGLGFNEVKDANREVDEWIPPAGLEVAVPTQWIPPRSSYRGVVINIPEMRLYLFPEKTNPGEDVIVHTWAIGIGTETTPSPAGPFRITSKDANPTWYVPDSIYRKMDPPKRRVVKPGPDNPLGEYRLKLSKGLYAIHGTNTPWSIGRLTTHGCIRLYPEDIGDLFRMVRVGTAGQLLYQPIKLGESAGDIYVEVHEDLYRRVPNLERAALNLAREARVIDRIDTDLLRQAVREKRGVPVVVTSRRRLAAGSAISTADEQVEPPASLLARLDERREFCECLPPAGLVVGGRQAAR
jgi:L,D-transpeptidase ErfK/SrfK